MSLHAILAVLSGTLVGFILGLIGGGGSILAVPLLIYVVGVSDAHVAIGTSAVVVTVSALINLVPHTLAGNVRWRPAALFALVGVLGAAIGSTLGKHVNGQRLLVLFALVMIVIAALLQRPVPASLPAAPRAKIWMVSGTGLAAGTLSGFFGIGGGFLIVPGLRLAAQLPMIEAIGSSLVAVAAFGIATAINYAFSSLIAWPIAAEFVVGSVVGGLAGTTIARRLARGRSALSRVFGVALLAVAMYMLARSRVL